VNDVFDDVEIKQKGGVGGGEEKRKKRNFFLLEGGKKKSARPPPEEEREGGRLCITQSRQESPAGERRDLPDYPRWKVVRGRGQEQNSRGEKSKKNLRFAEKRGREPPRKPTQERILCSQILNARPRKKKKKKKGQ